MDLSCNFGGNYVVYDIIEMSSLDFGFNWLAACVDFSPDQILSASK